MRTEVHIEGRTLSLSNLDKVLWPRVGLTKVWLIEYYTRVAPVLLPHIRGHPMTLHRFPDGVDGMHWFETRAPPHPAWVETVRFEMARSGKVFDCVVTDLPSLIWAGQMAAVELHRYLQASAPSTGRRRSCSTSTRARRPPQSTAAGWR